MRFLNNNVETKFYNGSDYFMVNSNSGCYLFTDTHTKRELLNTYTTVAPLNTALKVITTQQSKVEPYLYDTEKDEYISNHPFLDLLRNPSYGYNWDKFVKEYTVHSSILDNFYLKVDAASENKPPFSLEIIRPDYVNILNTNTTDNLPNNYQINYAKSIINFNRNGLLNPRYFSKSKKQEFLPMVGINTITDDFEGKDGIRSIYIQCLKYFETNNHNLSILKNGARPTGALVLKSKDGCNAELNDEQFERLKQQMKEEYSGSNNSGKPLVLEGGLEFQPMNLTNRDMDFLEGIKYDAKSIYTNLQIPLAIVGEDKTTFNSYPEARKALYQDVVLPKTQTLLDFLYNNVGLPRYPDLERYKLTYKKDEIPALEESTIEMGLKIIEKARDFISRDEGRALLGYNSEEDADRDGQEDAQEQEKAQFVKLMKRGGYNPQEIMEAVKSYYDKDKR